MTSFAPTPDQAKAIGHPRADACVIAGAGSGKTAVLTRRYRELLLRDGLSPRRVAALTFTEKAAAEMRDRITRMLGDEGHHQLRDEVDVAPISTIHAFCARLLRVHAIEAGLDPAFSVLDETEALLLLEDAWNRTLERVGADEGEGAADLGVLTQVGVSDDDLRTFLERVRGSGADVACLGWYAAGIDVAATEATVERALAELLAEAATVGDDLLARAEAVGRAVREAVAVPGGDRAWHLDAARAVAADLKKGARKLVKHRNDLVAALDDLVGAALDDLGRDVIQPPLVRILAAVAATYQAMKHERGALDFTDLERGAAALLARLEADGRAPAGAPEALLVDEFQDTNPLQASILHRLRRGGCSLFSVGDPKQSIYRFRRADVTVIQREHERVGEEGRHLLRATFRARPQVVDVLNEVHASLFAGNAAGVEHVPLAAEGTFRDVGGTDVEFAVVDVGDGTNATARREAEARWIAAWIQDLVLRRLPRAKVGGGSGDAETESPPLGYGDIAILFRARSSLSIYEEALSAAGVPFHTHKGRGYFQAEEVVDLVHALRVIHDPADDHALACFATGPALGADDGDLLACFGGDEGVRRHPGDAWQRLVLRSRADDADPRLCAVVSTVEALRREAVTGRLGRVVEGVLYDLGLLEVALLQPDGPRRAANLRKAVAVARSLERSGRADLHDLLRHLSLLREREVPEAEASLGRAGEDVVVLNTIHGAKGLEYPVVILADTGRRPPAQGDGIAFDDSASSEPEAERTARFAVSLRHPLEGKATPPGGLALLRAREKERAEEESRRLLYVALTRAEERLLVTGACSGFTKGKVRKPKYYEGWGPELMAAFGGLPPPGGADVAMGRGTARVAIVDPPPPPPTRPAATPLGAAGPAAREEAARVLAEADRPVAPLGDTPYVVTVSDLLHFAASPAAAYARRLESAFDASVPALAAREPDDPASGSESADPEAARREERRALTDDGPAPADDVRVDRASLGRALHTLLEHLEGERGGVSEAEIARVLDDEGLDAAVGETLRAMVERFVRSPSGRRLAEALRAGADVRRELAFHARIRFPAGVRVGAHDALLVRGSIDLWLPETDGVWIVDHKTNPRSRVLDTPAAVGRHYDWQLRLYALAAERLLGEDVAGARLLLLDPSWGADPVEVAVDVSGPALEDARRLCEAYAVAELEGRWPSDWRDLLPA